MPQIRPYEQQLSANQGIPAQQAQGSDFGGPGLTNIGEAAIAAGQHFAYAQHVANANYSRQAVTDAHVFLLEKQAEFTRRAQDIETKADPSDSNIWSKFAFGEGGTDDAPTEDSVKQVLDDRYQKEVDPDAQRTLQVGIARMMEQFSNHFVNVQARLAGTFAKQNAMKSMDHAKAIVLNDPSQYENTLFQVNDMLDDKAGQYVKLLPDQKEPIRRLMHNEIGESALEGTIRRDPVGALEEIRKGTWNARMSGDKLDALTKRAETGIHSQEVAARQADAEARRKRTELADTTEGVVTLQMARWLDDPRIPMPKATSPEMQQLAVLDADKHKAMLSMMHSWATADRNSEAKGDASLMGRMLEQIHKPWGDPQKMVSETPMVEAAAKLKLSQTQFTFLRKEFENAKTETGRKLGEEMTTFIKKFEKQIDKSNPLMGKIDQRGSERYGDFTTFVRRQVDQSIAENKNPYELFDERSPRYLKPFVSNFETDMKSSMQEMSRKLRQAPSVASPETGAVNPELKIRPGESMQDYLKRRRAAP